MISLSDPLGPKSIKKLPTNAANANIAEVEVLAELNNPSDLNPIEGHKAADQVSYAQIAKEGEIAMGEVSETLYQILLQSDLGLSKVGPSNQS